MTTDSHQAFMRAYLHSQHAPLDPDRFRVKEDLLDIRYSTCQFGTPNDYRGYHAALDVEILSYRRDANKKVVYLVKPLDPAIRILGAAGMPSLMLNRVLKVEGQLYCANYYSYVVGDKVPSHQKTEAQVRRLLRF